MPDTRLIYIQGNIEKFAKNIAGKKTLILGSGPSAREIDWESSDWECLLTTSFFYLNEDVIRQKPCHVSLSKIIDIENQKLHEYLDLNPNCTVSFEPKIEKYIGKSFDANCQVPLNVLKHAHSFYRSQAFENFFKKYADRMFFYRCLGGLEGLAGRLCWLTLNYRPSNISICGIDGVSLNRNNDPQNYFRNHAGTMDDYTYEDYLTSFEDFAEKLYQSSNNLGVTVNNLGKGKSYNMLTRISKKYEK